MRKPSPPAAPRRTRQAWVQAEALNVAPSLIGQPLATPWRRAWALLIDVAVVALLAHQVPDLILAGMLVAGGAALWAEQRRRPISRIALGLATVLALAGAVGAFTSERRGAEDSELAPATEAAARADAAPGASAVALAHPGDAASAAPAADTASTAARLAQALGRISALEAEQAQAQRTEFDKLRERIRHWIDEFGPSYGWGLLYGSLLPMLWRGQTLGKRLLGLRVVELTGRPMTVWLGLKRYGGYAAGLATGGLGLAQVLWDPNRQALHDKAAHTVVIDLRAPRRPALPVPVDGCEPDSTGPDADGSTTAAGVQLSGRQASSTSARDSSIASP